MKINFSFYKIKNIVKKIRTNHLIKKSILYIFFNALNGAIPFFLLPVLTTYLSPAEYGAVSLFQTTLLFIIPVIGLSMGFNIDRLFFKVSKAELAISIGNMIYILVSMVLISTILLFVSFNFSNLIFIGLPIEWLIIIPTIAGFSAINNFNLILLRNNDFVKSFGFWQVGLTFLNLGLSLVFVVTLSFGWQGRALGIAIATCFVGIFSLLKMIRLDYIDFKYKTNEIKEILKLCLPLLLQGFGTFIIFQSNIYFINGILGKSEVGIYSVASAFAAMMGIFQDAISKTISPWFYKNLNLATNDLKQKIFKMNMLINFVLFITAFLTYFVSKILIIFMTNIKFHSAISLVLILAMASAFNGMYKISSVYFIHLFRTKLLSILTSITAVVSVILNYILISKMGNLGAAYALCSSLFLQFILVLFFSQKIYPLPIKEVFYSFIYRIKSK
ncbi:MAG: polysaccharide biosynthesis C-terminal domain-containing protein [Ignavibacteriae bacterium]|nr:polysaccharide biosynthesis C-terminal domain-containing protein [Ignavibacteriota bacterium]